MMVSPASFIYLFLTNRSNHFRALLSAADSSQILPQSSKQPVPTVRTFPGTLPVYPEERSLDLAAAVL